MSIPSSKDLLSTGTTPNLKPEKSGYAESTGKADDQGQGNFNHREHLFVVDGSVTPDVRFSGQIDLKESLGSDTLYHIQYGPSKQPLIIRSGKHAGLSPGDRVDLGFLWEHCHFFDPDTGKRIAVSI
ncbi:MAG: TOBE domain-containing protein [Desulfotignum sp.]|nr:TOBE domain-containing protein [Desulfotignum sp.]